ncbi:hypothetical protein B0H63DRAFT_1823 [Podospora didyma]|uniref:Uncharacterized protein n=1 Tax=Podospora didyma TaxID=330526 RepID=A0AAE0P3U4_9PEZI|nr:hypothetical protein B0H63DRAFT_1823 [Podospora didyma]
MWSVGPKVQSPSRHFSRRAGKRNTPDVQKMKKGGYNVLAKELRLEIQRSIWDPLLDKLMSCPSHFLPTRTQRKLHNGTRLWPSEKKGGVPDDALVSLGTSRNQDPIRHHQLILQPQPTRNVDSHVAQSGNRGSTPQACTSPAAGFKQQEASIATRSSPPRRDPHSWRILVALATAHDRAHSPGSTTRQASGGSLRTQTGENRQPTSPKDIQYFDSHSDWPNETKDIMSLRQAYERKENFEVCWIHGNDSPADAMTKGSPNKALETLITKNTVTMHYRPGHDVLKGTTSCLFGLFIYIETTPSLRVKRPSSPLRTHLFISFSFVSFAHMHAKTPSSCQSTRSSFLRSWTWPSQPKRTTCSVSESLSWTRNLGST